jgi:hypothetical protein
MSETVEGKRYEFKCSGDFVELRIAPIPRETAEYWLTRDKDELLNHAYGLQGEDDSTDAPNIEVGSLQGARHIEGCELKNGTLEVFDEDGNEVQALSLESDDIDVDDIEQIDLDSYLVDGGPTIVTRTCYMGEVSYHPETAVRSFDDAHWYVFIADTGREPFISAFHFGDEENGDEEVRAEGSGRCISQQVWLRVPDANGAVRESYHSITSDDDRIVFF